MTATDIMTQNNFKLIWKLIKNRSLKRAQTSVLLDGIESKFNFRNHGAKNSREEEYLVLDR